MLHSFGFVVLALAWLLPGHYIPWLTFQQEWASGAGAALIGLGVWVQQRKDRLVVPALAVFGALVASIAPLQWAMGQIQFHSDALLAWLYLSGFAFAMVAAANFSKVGARRFVDALFGACLLAGIVSVGMAATQWLQLDGVGFIDPLSRGSRPYANLAQPNHLATLLALSVIGLLWFYESSRISGVVACIGLVWLGAGIVMTQSRTGWLFVVLVSASALAMRRRTPVRTTPASVAVGVALFVLAVGSWGWINDALLLSSPHSLESRLQPGTRWQNWRNLLEAAGQAPWAGYGWTQVRLAVQQAAQSLEFPEAMVLNSHNLILDLVLWSGIPLGAAIAAVLFCWYVSRLQSCTQSDQWLLMLGITAVIAHSMLEYPLEYAYFLLPLGLLIGALEATLPRRGWEVSGRLFGAALSIPIVLLIALGIEYLKVEESARQLRFMMVGLHDDREPPPSPPDVVLLDALREYHRFWLEPARPGLSKAQLDHMRKVSQRYPAPPAQLRFALAAGLNAEPEEATRTLAVICRMHQAERCKEARASWAEAGRRYPTLSLIPFPEAGNRIIAKSS